MSFNDQSTADAPAEESRLAESQAELEIEENPKLAAQEGLAPQASDAAAGQPGGAEGAPSTVPPTDRADEPELLNEDDLPSDGRDPEGERMIEQLGDAPHLRSPQGGQ